MSGIFKGQVEVHVRHPMQLTKDAKSPRFVPKEAAETMVREGRAVWPGDPKTPPKDEHGR